MREQILRFLSAIDEELAKNGPEPRPLDLYLIGRAALILFHGASPETAMTSDVDVVQISSPAAPALQFALEQFGRGQPGAVAHGLYLEAVPDGLPPLPSGFEKRCTPFEGGWGTLRVYQLEIRDLAVTKLKRFATKDRDDLRRLCDADRLRPETLRDRLRAAFLWSTEKDGDPDYDRARTNLARVIAYIEGEARDL
jgi:hypothetical protein